MQSRRLDPPAGPLLAQDDGVLLHARGIRYARAARFAAPQRLAPWSDVLDAAARGPACPQLSSRLEWVTGPVVADLAMSPDCQVLSVTAPSDADGLPVMVWLHGGAYVSGGGEAPKYDADQLVRTGRVIVVRVSYRLGVLGYLSPSGVDNLGLRDQILALQWVRDNVAAFGGDPDRVTVFGQSAGGDSVFSLMLCQQTVGLFHRAIMQSAPLGVRTGREAMTAAMRVAAEAVTTGDVLDAQTAAAAAAARFGLVSGMPFGPIMGRDPLPSEAEVDAWLADAAKRVELLVGYTRNDGAPFVAMSARVARLKRFGPLGRIAERVAAAAMTQRAFGKPARRLARQWREYGGRSATFRVDWSPSDMGACHCIELPLLFDPAPWVGAPMLGGRPIDERLAETMRRNWTGFAHNGIAGLDSPALRFG
ncbi:carboxylesterase type B [Mycobacterium sp. JS623]|uniref:carboxylesterase family protein n=1 Tax=Mycobacterium sp. JS623 TaxID=212767 RepID=UPI0002A585F5|nr:carboxylesterase family protein [Mycobacterium sp. JS623]AGB26536.1 carboxylesterase type B [Mycobacterium sp. JS623]